MKTQINYVGISKRSNHFQRYINVKKHVTDYQGPQHSGERPRVIGLFVRPKHIRVH